MNKIRLGKAIWSSFCLEFTLNYDSELAKNTSKVERITGNIPLINCQIIYSITMSIMDEYPHFQKSFVCIPWHSTTAVSEQGLFQGRINCFNMWAELTSYGMKRWEKEQRQERVDARGELQSTEHKTCLSSLT